MNNKYKHLYQDDTYNFLAGVGVRDFAKITTYFRGSQYEENSVLMSQLNNIGIDMTKYNKFPQLDNLKNVLRFLGIDLKPDIFGCRTIGMIDKTYEVMVNNCKLTISIPELRYMLMLHSYYLKYQEEHQSTVDMVKFYEIIQKAKLFDGLPEDYVEYLKGKFIEILPILQQMKQYD